MQCLEMYIFLTLEFTLKKTNIIYTLIFFTSTTIYYIYIYIYIYTELAPKFTATASVAQSVEH